MNKFIWTAAAAGRRWRRSSGAKTKAGRGVNALNDRQSVPENHNDE